MGEPCPPSPGWCDTCNRRVRWAELQSCDRRNGGAIVLSATGCSDCRFASEPLKAADGSVIGTKGCGCSAMSKASGKTWVTCGLANRPVMEQIGRKCVRKEPKE